SSGPMLSSPHLLFLRLLPRPPGSTLFPYTTLFRSRAGGGDVAARVRRQRRRILCLAVDRQPGGLRSPHALSGNLREQPRLRLLGDRKSTRLNSSHLVISYAVFCLKKKTISQHPFHT